MSNTLKWPWRGRPVAQIVQANRWKLQSPDEGREPMGEPIGTQRTAVGPAENEPVGIRRRPLRAVVESQCLGGVIVECDSPQTCGGLRCAVDDLDPLAGDGKLTSIEVDVDPRQAEQLSAPQAGEGREVPQRVQRIVLDAVEEHRELVHRPHADGGTPAGQMPCLDPVAGPHHGPRPAAARQDEVQRRVVW